MRPLLVLCVAATLLLVACGGGSSDGKIVFVATGNDERLDVFVTNSDGTGLRNLTDHLDHDFGATWSPDATKIAFFSARDEEIPSRRFADLYVMNADGSSVERVAEIETGAIDQPHSAIWNPDGRRLLYAAFHIQTLITDVNGVEYDPRVGTTFSSSWSSDGERLVFYGYTELGGKTKLGYWSVHPYTFDTQLLFLPHGEVELGSSAEPCRDPRQPQISTGAHVQPVEQPPWVALVRTDVFGRNALQFSPSSGEALYSLLLCRDGLKNHDLAVRGSSLTNERLLTDGPDFEHVARWSPDGTKIAYVRQPLDAPPSLWVMNPDGSDKTLVADEAGQFSWSPDGSQIAFVGTTLPGSYTTDDFALFTVNVDGTDRKLIVDGLGLIWTLEWSPVE